MKITALTWDSNNVGDDVQTLAVEQHLPKVDFYIRRDDLKSYDGPVCLLVTNGWFDPTEKSWPPSDKIKPIFFGFHAQKRSYPVLAKYVDYLHKHAPIGCRDRATMNFLKSIGVDAYLSLCATLTFEPVREREARDLFVVDADLDSMRASIRDKHGLKVRVVSHAFMNLDTEHRLEYARRLLAGYGKTGGMVVTSRIHCAMPCVAMGIPVVFIARRNPRIEVVEEAGLKMHDLRGLGWRLGLTKVDAWPGVLDISTTKERIRADLLSRIDKALSHP